MDNRVDRGTNYTCEICSDEFLGLKSRVNRFCSRKCYWDSMKGKPIAHIVITDEEREKRKVRMMGKKNPMWKGGDSDKERRNRDYKKWRIKVFKRDAFTCVKCGYFNGCGEKRRDLNAHHIVLWIESNELRYIVDNGITLCVPCHIKEHSKNT